MNARWLVACAAVALAGCPGGRTVTQVTTTTPSSGDGDGDGAPDRVREVEATMLENYRLFASGAASSYAQGIARDRSVAVAGITPNTVLVGVWPDGIEQDRRPYQSNSVRILSKNLDVHIAANPSVAWVSDELSYRVPYKGREASVPIRFTGVYVRDIDRWLLVMEHMSYAMTAAELIAMAQRNELSILPPIPPARTSTTGQVREIQKHITALLEKWHSAGTQTADLVAADTDVLVMWPDPDAEYRGLAASAAPKLVEVFGDGAKLARSQYRVFVARNESVAWALANHTIELPGKHPFDLRGTYVLEPRGDRGKWSVVQAHVSVPLHIHQIDRKVFGIRRGR